MITVSNQIELRHLRYFLAVAEDLHFRKAAQRLYISQPGLSRQIKQLERELGFDLFKRHNRKVELTAAGALLKFEVTELLSSFEKSIEKARLLNLGIEGHLRLGYIGSAMHKIIPNLLLNMKENCPNVTVGLQEMDNQELTQKVLDGDIDLGFVRMDRVPRGVEIQPILRETFSLVLPKDHELGSHNFKSLSQLKDESFIMFDASYSPSYYEKVMQIFDDSGFQPIISHKSVKANTIYRLIENHLGAAIVPTSLKEGYDLKIKFIELDGIPHRTTLQVIWRKDSTKALVKRVLNLVKICED